MLTSARKGYGKNERPSFQVTGINFDSRVRTGQILLGTMRKQDKHVLGRSRGTMNCWLGAVTFTSQRRRKLPHTLLLTAVAEGESHSPH